MRASEKKKKLVWKCCWEIQYLIACRVVSLEFCCNKTSLIFYPCIYQMFLKFINSDNGCGIWCWAHALVKFEKGRCWRKPRFIVHFHSVKNNTCIQQASTICRNIISQISKSSKISLLWNMIKSFAAQPLTLHHQFN